MPPTRANLKEERKKRSVNLILTPNPKELVKRLRAENCAVKVFDLSDVSSKEVPTGSVHLLARKSRSRSRSTTSRSSSSSSSSCSSYSSLPESKDKDKGMASGQ